MGRLIAVIGAGGKTSSLRALCAAHSHQPVLMTTTTRILGVSPPETRVLLRDPGEEELLEALSQPGIICAGSGCGGEKLGSLPMPLLKAAAEQAELTVCEADGAKCLPLKLHRPWEPVIPGFADHCLILAGLSALGRPVSRVVHCWQNHPQWAEDPDRITGWQEIFYCIREAAALVPMPGNRISVFLNQADTLREPRQLSPLLQALEQEGLRARAGSLRKDPSELTDWI